MRLFRALLALAALLAFAGCGYVHFGKNPEAATVTGGDAALAKAYTDLGVEHKLLKQELALVRKEGDTLRAALDRRGDASPSEVATRLEQANRELATLRADYAKLQAARAAAGGPTDPALRAQLSATEDKLASTLRSFTELQDENARLRSDVSRVRAENTNLVAQLKTVTKRSEQAEASLAQLNGELLAQKEARGRSDQQASALRAQLATVIAAGSTPLAATRTTGAGDATAIVAPTRLADPATTGATRGSSAPPVEPTTALSIPQSDATTPLPTAELRANPARVAAAAAELSNEDGKRIYTVRTGDTLESISNKFYGTPSRWSRIYVVNNTLLRGDRPLKAGMKLEIPLD